MDLIWNILQLLDFFRLIFSFKIIDSMLCCIQTLNWKNSLQHGQWSHYIILKHFFCFHFVDAPIEIECIFNLIFLATTRSNINRRSSLYQIRIQFKQQIYPFSSNETAWCMTPSFIYGHWIASSVGKNSFISGLTMAMEIRCIELTLIKSVASAFYMFERF